MNKQQPLVGERECCHLRGWVCVCGLECLSAGFRVYIRLQIACCVCIYPKTYNPKFQYSNPSRTACFPPPTPTPTPRPRSWVTPLPQMTSSVAG